MDIWHRRLIAVLIAFLVATGSINAFSEKADGKIIPKEFFIGTVIGEEGSQCFYYTSPEESPENAVGFFNPGAQVLIMQYDPEWCHILLSSEGYIRTSDLSISQAPGDLKPIGYAFASFSLDDPDINPNGFIELLGDCDTEQPGDVIGNGNALQLIGYAGEMLQVRSGNYDGFIYKKHANILTFQELFLYPGDNRVFTKGKFKTGRYLPSGLYRASAVDGENAALLIANNEGGELVYKLDDLEDTPYTVYIPEHTTVSISEHGILTSITYREIESSGYANGRQLCGVDFEGAPEAIYRIVAENTEKAYYIESTLWQDNLLEAGKVYELAPNEEKSIQVLDGEILELHHCRLEKLQIGN
jgi:hypothetical protein